MKLKNFKLEVAIDEAYEEFSKLEEERRTPINLSFVARKYAPRTVQQCMDVLNEHVWIFAMESRPGFQLVDTVIATVTNYISAVLLDRWEKEMQQKIMKEVRDQKQKVQLYRP